MTKDKWIWMPHAGHFIGAKYCRFILNTYVGKYIVSTVGEYWPDYRVRKIIADSRGWTCNKIGDYWDREYFKKFGYEDIGCDRKYETMVFAAHKSEKYKCCPYEIDVSNQKDFAGYNDADAATKGHMSLCRKWSKK